MSAPDLRSLRADHGDPFAEARACRAACALFDFSFVRRARVRGPRAVDDVQRFCGRNMTGLRAGEIRYALRCGADGAVEADLTVWRIDDDSLEVMSGRGIDIVSLQTNRHPSTTLQDLSDQGALFAVQGPQALRALAPLTDLDRLQSLAWFRFTPLRVAGIECLVARLGYSGERGFELLAPAEHAATLWDALAARARPAGFAAIDMLRIEAGLMLFTHECRARPRAAELGLESLVDAAQPPARMRLACFRVERGGRPLLWQPASAPEPPRPGTLSVTSAAWSVHANAVLGLGFAVAGEHLAGTRLLASERRFGAVELTTLPWLGAHQRRIRAPWDAAERTAARFATAIDPHEWGSPSIKP